MIGRKGIIWHDNNDGWLFFFPIDNDVAALLPAGVENGQIGDQSGSNNENNSNHPDDDGRMTFKIPNIGGQVIINLEKYHVHCAHL